MPTNTQHGFLSRLIVFCFLGLTVTMSVAQTKHFVTEPSPPFNYLEDGNVAGPAFEIIDSICDQMSITCKFKLTKWERAILSAQNAEVNGIFSIGKTTERAQWMYFSTPILETAYGIYVNKNDPLIYKNGSDLSGYTVVTYGPSNTSKSLEKLRRKTPSMKVKIESNSTFALKRFDVGRYGDKSALYLNRDVVDHLIKTMKLKNIRFAGDDRKLSYYVGFPKESNTRKFVSDFNRALEKSKQDGTLEQLLKPFDMTPPE